MPKEWILNSTMNRFQLNFKRNVGATSESVRKCAPKTLEDWRRYYYANVKSEQDIEELGRKLYVKITEVVQSEVADITEQDCIDYMKQMVIERTFEGYTTEIQTVYGQLRNALNIDIVAAPDEWDRLYNVDFYIRIDDYYIGLQIKPVNQGVQLPEIFKEYAIQQNTHVSFTKKYGGKVFYLFSQKIDGKKTILNKEVIDDIRVEINRLNILTKAK